MKLEKAFLEELSDILHAEKQLTKALPKLLEAVSENQLREAFKTHLDETREHVHRVEQVFGFFGRPAKAKTCQGMQGILSEGEKLLKQAEKLRQRQEKETKSSQAKDSAEQTAALPPELSAEAPTEFDEVATGKTGGFDDRSKSKEQQQERAGLDAAIIAAAQKAEHYEMATYGTLCAWARLLENQEAEQLLAETLEEEKAADQKLTELAERLINPEAERGLGAEASSEQGRSEDEEESGTEGRSAGASGSARAGRASRGENQNQNRKGQSMDRESTYGGSGRGNRDYEEEFEPSRRGRGGRSSQGARYEEDEYQGQRSFGRSGQEEFGGSSGRGRSEWENERGSQRWGRRGDYEESGGGRGRGPYGQSSRSYRQEGGPYGQERWGQSDFGHGGRSGRYEGREERGPRGGRPGSGWEEESQDWRGRGRGRDWEEDEFERRGGRQWGDESERGSRSSWENQGGQSQRGRPRSGRDYDEDWWGSPRGSGRSGRRYPEEEYEGSDRWGRSENEYRRGNR